jgi:multiple antibiotic resistance protein
VSDGLLDFAIKAFTSIFIIVDPPGNIPIFLSLTSGYDDDHRRRASLMASLTCFGVLSLFAVGGSAIMSFFSISIPALRIAGGIIIFVIGLQMVHVQRSRTKTTPEEEAEWSTREEAGLVPMGIPLLAGPGAITTVVVLTQTGPSMWALPVVVTSVALTCLLNHFILMQSKYLNRLLGRVGINILVRLMGLILTVIAVQLVLNGLAGALPRLREGLLH